MVLNGRSLVRQEFSFSYHVRQYSELHVRVLNRRARQTRGRCAS
jgi:hypothetical protein